MLYEKFKIEDQELAFHIKTTHNGEEISFNVVCGSDESEIDELVNFYLQSLTNPPVYDVIPQEPNITLEEAKLKIESLEARIAVLESN